MTTSKKQTAVVCEPWVIHTCKACGEMTSVNREYCVSCSGEVIYPKHTFSEFNSEGCEFKTVMKHMSALSDGITNMFEQFDMFDMSDMGLSPVMVADL